MIMKMFSEIYLKVIRVKPPIADTCCNRGHPTRISLIIRNLRGLHVIKSMH